MSAYRGTARYLSWAIVAAGMSISMGPAPAQAQWGGKGSDVVDLTLHKELKSMEKSPYIWGIALYRDGCGYCELLKPEWNKVAQKLRKMAGIAAVDVVTHGHIAKALTEKYRFNITGVPTVIMLKPTSNGGKRKFMINGRKSKAIINELVEHMPEHVATISDDSYSGWEKREGPKALLFTEKKDTPPVLKALSTKYRGRMHFGITLGDNKKLKAKFGVTELPKLFVIENDKVVDGSYKPIEYTGSSRFVTMDFFLMDYAVEKEKGKDKGKSTTNSDSSKGSSKGSSTKKKENESDEKDEELKAQKAAEKEKRKAERKAKRDAAKKEEMEKRKSKSKQKTKPKKLGKLRTLPQPSNPIKLKGAKLDALSVKDLRGILARWDDPCSGCVEKDQFLMKIAENRKLHGDMESVAQAYAKKGGQKKNRKRTAAHPDGEPTGSTGQSNDPFGDNDVLCGRLLELETGPLRHQIDDLQTENDELKRQIAALTENLIHEEL